MSADPLPPPVPAGAPRGGPYVLVCDECLATRACSADDVLEFARGGWPRCCGRGMSVTPECGPAPDPPPA